MVKHMEVNLNDTVRIGNKGKTLHIVLTKTVRTILELKKGDEMAYTKINYEKELDKVTIYFDIIRKEEKND